MSLLNYTTKVSADKTAGEIQLMLAKAKASAILTEYDQGILSAVSFRIQTVHGIMSFRLPANINQVFQVIVRDRRISQRLRTKEQAARVAWRIVKDWLAAQLAFIEAGQASVEQLFLHCAQDPKTGETVYERLLDQHFTGLMLPENASAN